MSAVLDEIIDPHIHLFDAKNTPRPTQPLARALGWNEQLLRAVAKRAFPKPTLAFFTAETDILVDYMTAELRADQASFPTSRYVHIEAGWKNRKPLDAVGETAWLETLEDPPAGIVAHADLSLGADVRPVLDAHRAASDRVRGIRHMLAHHPSEGVMDFADDPSLSGRASFRQGLEQLQEAGLSFDAWAYSHQLGAVADLASSHPELPIILCHGGTPVGYGGPFQGVGTSVAERSEIAAQWRDGIDAVAANPNVSVKLSGFLMPVVGFGLENRPWPTVATVVDRIGPLVQHCVEAFGPDRCMVASNFPVDRVSSSYRVLFDAMIELTNATGPDAQAAMFAGTAATVYQL